MSVKSHCVVAKCRNQTDLCEGLQKLLSWIGSQQSGIALVLEIPYCPLVSCKAFAMTLLPGPYFSELWAFLQPQMYLLCRACHQLMPNGYVCGHRLVSRSSPREHLCFASLCMTSHSDVKVFSHVISFSLSLFTVFFYCEDSKWETLKVINIYSSVTSHFEFHYRLSCSHGWKGQCSE